MPQIPAVKSLNMANTDFWRTGLKTANAEDCQETKTCLFAILGWLEQANLENPCVAPGEFISYLKFSFSKYVLRYNPSIFISYSRFPYKEDTVNEWFDLAPEEHWPQRDEAVRVINVDKDGRTRKCYTTQTHVAFPESLEDDDFDIFFHGTEHGSAQDILEHGINLRICEKKPQDFSHKDWFYLGDSFDEALGWTGYRGYPDPAVLVFRVKKIELRGENNDNGLDLRGPAKKEEWQRVIKEFRSGNPRKSFLKEIRDDQFIEGPMASISRENPRTPHPVQKDGSYQLCVRKDSCAELFDCSLHSVLFFG